VATEEFDLIGGTERDLARKQELDKRAETEGGLLGAQAFQDFVVPSKDPIGVKLLRRMGWKPGQGVGARISAAKRRKLTLAGSESENESDEELDANISFAPRDSAIIVFAQKRDTFGLGFDPYKNIPDISDIKQARAERSMGNSTAKSTDYNKAGFGIGVLDDDDDDDVYTNFSSTTYSHELKDEYDIEERITMGKRPKPSEAIPGSSRYDVDRAKTKRSGHDGRAPLHGFAYGKQDALQEKW
jgi:G patch domain-containing protein 1